MRLAELEPEFYAITDAQHFRRVATIAEADGFCFLCPKCFCANNGPIGTHSVICWQPHVPANIRPAPGRWKMQGSDVNDLTLVAASSSVLLTAGCRAHFFIRAGIVEDADGGKTVPPGR